MAELPVVSGEPVDAATNDALAAKTLDEDLSALLSLGLQLSDVERLWARNRGVDMSDVYAVATDDVMHFTTQGAQCSHERMAALDQSFSSDGIIKNDSLTNRHHSYATNPRDDIIKTDDSAN